MRTCILLPLFAVAISSCTSVNSRHPVANTSVLPKASENCPVHGNSMNWGKLPSDDWTTKPSGFMDARRERFPFNGCYYASCCGGGIGQDVGWVCPDCVQAAARWKKAH